LSIGFADSGDRNGARIMASPLARRLAAADGLVLADVTGSYESGFSILAAFAVLGFFCFLAATPPAHPARERR
jgi:hypothetical protein